MTQVELKNVAITYRQRQSFFKHKYHQVLTDVSFDIFNGETLGIIGRNGCGKSTLLKVIGGIIEPDNGSIKHGDLTVSLQTLGAGFDAELSGRDNAIIASMLLGHDKSVAISYLNQINDFAELQDKFEDPVKTYSSGMRARLGFSVATMMSVDVLLIDEVLGVGDESFRKKAEKSIIDKIEGDQTVVLVSHNAKQISRLCDRVVWLEKGGIKEIGEPQKVLSIYHQFMEDCKVSSK